MSRMIGVLALCMLAVFMIFGCTQGTQTTSTGTDTGTGTGTETGTGTTTGTTTGTDSAYTQFKSMVTGMPVYYAAYDLVTSGEESEMMHWFKSGQMRQDVSVQGMETRMYLANDKVVTCTDAMGSFVCYDFPETEASLGTGTEEMKENVDSLEGKITQLPGRTVAGEVASCFKVNDEEYPYTYCYTADGIPVYIEVVSGEYTTTMTAYEISRSVDDSVFVLPAEPSPMPGYE